MAKIQKKPVAAPRAGAVAPEPEPKALIPEKYQDLVYILAIALLVFIFFSKAIFSGGFSSVDNVASGSFATYVEESGKNGENTQWMPYIFGGMPSFAALLAGGARSWDFTAEIFFGIIGFIGKVFSSDVARMVCYYILYGIGLYILMRSKKHERYIAFFVAVGGIFSTYVITWVMIGHNTKPIVFAMFPFIIFFMEKLREKFSLLYLSLMILAVHIMMEAGHLQMIFYGILVFAIYLVFEFINRLVTKSGWQKVVIVGVFLAMAGGIAFVMSSDRYLSTLEYTPYSTRGSGPILNQGNHQDAEGGNDYEYATMWSFSPGETMTFFVPGYFGHGTQKYNGQMQPTYWGQKESEDSPPYMGIAVLVLAILGFVYYRKDAFVQAMAAIAVFSLFLSFGKNMEFLYNLFYYNFPSFNKFRAPSMALAMMHFSVPVLAGYGLTSVINIRKRLKNFNPKALLYTLYASAGFLGVGLIFSAIFKQSYSEAVAAKHGTTAANIPPELSGFLWSGVTSDWFIGAIILIITIGAAYFYTKGKLNRLVLFLIVLTLLLADLWRVDFRRMEVQPQTIEQDVFAKHKPLYYHIKHDKSLYRVADFVARPENIPAYFLVQSVNGYHSAKLRLYQDLMDVANNEQLRGSTSYLYNPFLWNLLNVKYIIQPGQNGIVIDTNRTMLPRAFFVDSAVVEKPLEILYHLRDGDFDPRKTAFLEKELPAKIEPAGPAATAEVKSFSDEKITIEANATGNNLLFISEIYYSPAWKAFIDGKETEIFKANFAFRSVIVPQGKHTISLEYRSEKFETGKYLSLIANIIAGLALALGLVAAGRRKFSQKKTEE